LVIFLTKDVDQTFPSADINHHACIKHVN
jgi:hypothetical protein